MPATDQPLTDPLSTRDNQEAPEAPGGAHVAILDATHHSPSVGPDHVVAGLSMARRQLRMAKISGCDEAIVVTLPALEAVVRAELQASWFDTPWSVQVIDQPRIDTLIRTLDPLVRPKLANRAHQLLYFKTSTAYHRHLPGHVRARAARTDGICVYQDPHSPAPIDDLFATGHAGWLALSESVEHDIEHLEALFRRLQDHHQDILSTFSGDDHAWHLRLADGSTADQATEQIWQDCRKSVDGPVSRHFNRHISLFISRRVAGWGIKANHVTAITALLGILGGLLGLIGGYWGFLAAALAYKANSVIDGVDGEMARGKYEFSEWGAWLDNFSDDSKDIFFYVGVSIGAWQTDYALVPGLVGSEGWLWVLGVTLFGKAMSLTGYYSFLIQHRIGDLRHFQFWFEEEDEAARDGLVHQIMASLKVLTKNDVMVLGAVILALVGLLPWYIFLSAIGQVAAGANILAARVWQLRTGAKPAPAE